MTLTIELCGGPKRSQQSGVRGMLLQQQLLIRLVGSSRLCTHTGSHSSKQCKAIGNMHAVSRIGESSPPPPPVGGFGGPRGSVSGVFRPHPREEVVFEERQEAPCEVVQVGTSRPHQLQHALREDAQGRGFQGVVFILQQEATSQPCLLVEVTCRNGAVPITVLTAVPKSSPHVIHSAPPPFEPMCHLPPGREGEAALCAALMVRTGDVWERSGLCARGLPGEGKGTGGSFA